MKTNKYTPSPIKGMPNAPEAEQAVNGSLLSIGGDKVFDAISSDLRTDMFLISGMQYCMKLYGLFMQAINHVI